MPIIAPADLNNQMYAEIQTIITRGDTTKAVTAIAYAIDEAKMFLSRYDLLKLFGNDDATPPIAAIFTSPALTEMVKTMATWHLLRLANPNVDMAVARSGYEDCISRLKSIQSGRAEPYGWPYQDTTNETAPQGDSLEWTSNHKSHNYFY